MFRITTNPRPWVLICLLAFIAGNASIVVAANDPGHDSLYVLKIGDNITGSINVSGNVTATLVQATSRFFGPNLDIRGDGTSSTAPTRIIGTSTNLELSTATGGIVLEKNGGYLQIGTTSTPADLLVNGTIQQANVPVCLQNGTNCPSTSSAANITGSGSTGYDAVWTSTSNLGTGILWQNTTNVGIGTTSPAQKLEVNGNTKVDSNYMYVGSGGGAFYGDASNMVVHMPSAGHFYMANVGTDGTMVQQSDGSLRVGGPGQTSANLWVYGNVGIGTTAPANTLSVNGTINASGNVYDNGNRVCTSNNGLCGTGGANITGSGTTGYDAVWTSGSNLATGTLWQNSTNVGIGTTGPSAPLTVQNTADATLTKFLLSKNDGGSAQGIYIEDDRGYAGSGNTGTTLEVVSYNNYGSGTLMSLDTAGTNGKNVMTAKLSGNVGIGTTRPNAKLDVMYAGSEPSLTHGTSVGLSVGVSGFSQLALSQSVTPPYAFSLQTRHTTADGYTYPIALNPLGGNVGIGTTAPDANLMINGSVYSGTQSNFIGTHIQNTADGGDATIWLQNSAKNAYLRLKNNYDSTWLKIDDGTNTRMIIDNNGNVGLGTVNLVVNDAISSARPLVVTKADSGTTVGGGTANVVIDNTDTTTNNTAQLTFAAGTGASTTQFAAASITAIFGPRTNGYYPIGQLAFLTSTALNNAPTEKMRLDNNGNLGIGTTSPGSKLSVIGGGLFVGSSGWDSTTAGTGNIENTGNYLFHSTGIHYIQDGDVGNITFRLWSGSANVDAMTLTNTGNVGIGTTSPGYKLDVSGNIATTPSTSNAVKSANFVSNSPGALSNFGGTDGGFYFIPSGSGAMSFVTAGADRVRIDTSGNVGIGTTAPANTLSVNGTVNASGNVYDNGNRVCTSNNGLCGSGGANVSGSGTANYVARWANTTSLSTGLLYDNGTNVGIGTTTPGFRLEVRDGNVSVDTVTDRPVGYVVTPNGADLSAYLYTTGNNANHAGHLDLYDGNNEVTQASIALYNSSGTVKNLINNGGNSYFTAGNVGIGTTGPLTRLHVALDVGSPSTNTYLQANIGGATDTNKALNLGYDTTNNVGIIQSWWRGQNMEPLALNPFGGNVGIGTTSPGANLDVQGGVLRVVPGAGGNFDEGIRINNAGNGFAMLQLGGSGVSGTGADQWSKQKPRRGNLWVCVE
jgi:hypothetical protein